MPPSDNASPGRLVLVATRLLLTRRGPAARQIESTVGRHLATVGLGQLGRLDTLVGQPGDRPEWPGGTSGSISHNRAGLCVAAVTDSQGTDMIGVDVEVTNRLQHVATELFTDTIERLQLRRLARDNGDDPLLWKARMFAAKEATWKALTTSQGDQRVAVTFNRFGGFIGHSPGARVKGVTVTLDGEVLAIAIGDHHPTEEAWWQRVLFLWRHVAPYPSFAGITLPLRLR